MKDWQRILIGPTVPLRDALEAIDKAGSRIVLVVDEARHLLGSLSDGDVRRALLRGLTLADPVASAMHVGPTTAGAGEGKQAILARMRKLGLYQMPIVGPDNVVVGMEIVDDLLTTPERGQELRSGPSSVRLLHVIPSLDVGGVQTRIVDIANGLPGFEHTFLALDRRYDALSRLAPHVTKTVADVADRGRDFRWRRSCCG